MKLKIIIIALCLFLTGCDTSYFFQEENFHSQETEANLILDKLLIALENKNNNEIKNLFANDLINSSNTLDDEIQKMIDYFEGSIKSYKEIGTVAGEVSYENGRVTFSRIGNALSDEIITDNYTYQISFAAILVNENNNASEGIWRIWIGKNESDYLIVGSPDGSRI